MFELQWVVNEQTGEKRLYFRHDIFAVDASGAFCPSGKTSAWKRVPELTLEESSLQDLIESGGLPEDA